MRSPASSPAMVAALVRSGAVLIVISLDGLSLFSAEQRTLRLLLLEVLLARRGRRLERRHLRDGHVPPPRAVGRVDERIAVDVDHGRRVRRLRAGDRGAEVVDRALAGLDLDRLDAVAAGVRGEVDGQEVLALEVARLRVVGAVLRAEALGSD